MIKLFANKNYPTVMYILITLVLLAIVFNFASMFEKIKNEKNMTISRGYSIGTGNAVNIIADPKDEDIEKEKYISNFKKVFLGIVILVLVVLIILSLLKRSHHKEIPITPVESRAIKNFIERN